MDLYIVLSTTVRVEDHYLANLVIVQSLVESTSIPYRDQHGIETVISDAFHGLARFDGSLCGCSFPIGPPCYGPVLLAGFHKWRGTHEEP